MLLLKQFIEDCNRYERTKEQIQRRGAEAVKQLRNELRLSQCHFAGRLGVSRACLCMIENGRMALPFALAKKMLEVADEAKKKKP